MSKENNFCILMAGGVGTRFWPMSKTSKPKQFHDILGTGRTLIQQTFDRILKVCPPENIFVVTNKLYKNTVSQQLPELNLNQILCEPCMRNTAPCIAYATHKIGKINSNANIIVAPADHLILKEDIFADNLLKAIEVAQDRTSLVTLGIKPSRPDTGYGYIQFKSHQTNQNGDIREVISFTEKPQIETAREFVEKGNYFWNSGIFIWNIDTIIKAFETFLPEMNEIFKKGNEYYNTAKEQEFIDEIFPNCESISIDYGIMEKASPVKVVLSDFGWSDLGTWGSLYGHLDKDENMNAIQGENVISYDLDNCIVKVPNDKLVVLQGLSNYIVVESENSLLVCKKSEEQRIKEFVGDVKSLKGEKFV